jgi:ADP-ribose pyrophosphatase YjhB (NUDIX family)
MIQISGVLLKVKNKYLLVQEKLKKVYGLWNLPAGHVDEDETLQEAAKREAEEETGLKVKIGKELLVTTGDNADVEVHIFAGEIIGGELTLHSEEVLDVKWFGAKEIENLNLRSSYFIPLFQ